MLPQRPSTPGQPAAARKSGPIAFPQVPYETVRRRVLAKLEERLDMSASKRMPQSLLRQSLRQHADQVADIEARSLPKADRDRLVEEVLGELLGYGPLEELFADPAVRGSRWATSGRRRPCSPAPGRPRRRASRSGRGSRGRGPRRGTSRSSAATGPARARILERLLTKLANLKVYDVSRFDAHELEKIISAYVTEYGQTEKIYLSDTDQGRLTLEILTSLRR
jgi:hypothetical protein